MSRAILVTIGLAAVVLLAACGGGASDPASPAVDSSSKIDAWVMAQTFLEEGFLKSPSTADYGGVLGGDYQDPDECVSDLGNGEYLVRGWVDAQNGFGATVRNNFAMKLGYEGDDRWRLLAGPAVADYPERPVLVDLKQEERENAQAEAAAAAARELRRAQKAARAEAVEQAKWRTWSTASGKHQVEAKFVSSGPDGVRLEKRDGKTVTVKLEQLGDADRKFIADRAWQRAP